MSASLRPAARASAFSSAIARASGLGPARGRSTRLTRRPTASRLRASARAAAASGSTGMVTSTVSSIRTSLDENNSRGDRLHAATSIEADMARDYGDAGITVTGITVTGITVTVYRDYGDSLGITVTVYVFALCFTAAVLAARCLLPVAALGRVCGALKGGRAGVRALRSIPGFPAGGRWWEPARSGSSSPRRSAWREAPQNQGSVRATAPPLQARHFHPRAAPECSTMASPRHGSPTPRPPD